MKKLYQNLEMQVLLFGAEDIVTASANEKDDVGVDIFDD